jgi:hypothetical protein
MVVKNRQRFGEDIFFNKTRPRSNELSKQKADIFDLVICELPPHSVESKTHKSEK